MPRYAELNATLLNGEEVVSVSSTNLIDMDGVGQHTLSMVPPNEDPDTGNVYQLIINWTPVEPTQ
jgi:hypothetical protein